MTFLLIVEDELPIRELVSFVCEREGFEVVGAADVGEACAALKTRRPDLILLDRMLPDAGADDYIVKPFFPRELVARIRAVLRRQGQEKARVERSDENVVRCGPLVMNEARFEASVDGVPVKLSGKEFRLLHLFASHPGRVFSRAQLLEAVWESVYVDERTVDVHMLRLRKALAGTAAEDLIETVRGVGYRCRGL